jgi:peptidoglycan/LPS O-acetylase OafA/YrhL
VSEVLTAAAVRYRMLDAWRGIAALTVVVYHCTGIVVKPEMGWWAEALLYGWTGVYIFFPISGYCIYAAISRGENGTVGHFVRRRWRRIAPPYWASLLLAIGVGFLASPFNGGLVGYLNLGAAKWLSVVTLTQVFSSEPYVINPVYWSLCYEEQFYIVMALTLLAPDRYRLRLLLGVTVVSALYLLPAWPAALQVQGLFLRHWLEFASGIAVFTWLNRRQERRFALAVLGLAIAMALVTRDLGLEISAAVACVLIALAPFDEAIATTRVGAALGALGLFSYSLYLVHVPIGGRVVNLLRRGALPLWLPPIVAIVVSVFAGWCFYQIVERRFINRDGRLRPPSISLAADPTVAPAA